MSKLLEQLNNLPDNTEMLNLEAQNLEVMPDISRFHNLKRLYCENNHLTSLPTLPPTLEILYCHNNHLTTLPTLPQKLKILCCNNNQLTLLPPLNNVLHKLHCCNNELTLLPILNNVLHALICGNNQLSELPLLNNVRVFYYSNNPIYNIVSHLSLNIVKQNVEKLYRFKYLYYLLKFKKRLRDWLWIRIREPKIREKYSAANLLKLLDEEDVEKLNNW
jgi:hypothetical protein